MKIVNSKLRKTILFILFPFIFIFSFVLAIIYAFLQEWKTNKWLLLTLIVIIVLNILLFLQITNNL